MRCLAFSRATVRRPSFDGNSALVGPGTYRDRQASGARSGFLGFHRRQRRGAVGDQHYQDDERFAGSLVRSRVAQGYGPMRIRAELKTHGLSDAGIRALLDEADVDWNASAAAQLRRRFGSGSTQDRDERARRAQFLLRRGFPAATVRSVTHADVDDAADDA